MLKASSQIKYLEKRYKQVSIAEWLGTSSRYLRQIKTGKRSAGIYNAGIDELYNYTKAGRIPCVRNQLNKNFLPNYTPIIFQPEKQYRRKKLNNWHQVRGISDIEVKTYSIKIEPPIITDYNLFSIYTAIEDYITNFNPHEKYFGAIIAVKGYIDTAPNKFITLVRTTVIEKEDFKNGNIREYFQKIFYLSTTNPEQHPEKCKINFIEFSLIKYK